MNRTSLRTVCALALASLAATACSEGAAAPAWPEGTALVLEDIPIQASQVESAAAAVAVVRPLQTRPQHLRVALTRGVFPVVAARALAPQAREDMRARADREREARVTGTEADLAVGPIETELQGTWYDLGPILGPVALKLPIGEWSPVVEAPGAWVLMRVVERSEPERLVESTMRVRVVHFDFVSGGEYAKEIVAWLDAAELEVVDPTYGDVLPEWWRHRLKGRDDG